MRWGVLIAAGCIGPAVNPWLLLTTVFGCLAVIGFGLAAMPDTRGRR